jgi:predicted patatin/cPLA2 family phospholipase
MFKSQITNLINNIPERITKEPLELDIVLEGGGFNGSYELGVLYFIKELVERKYIKINRISGASIGSILGLCYLTNKLDLFIDNYKQTREEWRETISLKVIQKLIIDLCDLITEEEFSLIKNNKLYTTFFSLKDKKQIIKQNYETIDELKECIIKSCYLPYIVDNDIGYKCEEQYFIDGGHPYIFHNREKSGLNKILYISINQLKNIPKMITTKNENNIYGRVLKGILDCYEFFLNQNNGFYKETELCSYVNEWKTTKYISLYIKQFSILIFVYLITYIHILINKLGPYIENIEFYDRILMIIKNIYKDIILYLCF